MFLDNVIKLSRKVLVYPTLMLCRLQDYLICVAELELELKRNSVVNDTYYFTWNP